MTPEMIYSFQNTLKNIKSESVLLYNFITNWLKNDDTKISYDKTVKHALFFEFLQKLRTSNKENYLNVPVLRKLFSIRKVYDDAYLQRAIHLNITARSIAYKKFTTSRHSEPIGYGKMLPKQVLFGETPDI